MPPKRKVPARRASTGKRISFGIPRTPSGRPQRRGTIEINYKDTLRGPGSSGYQADHIDAPKTTDTPKKRGRPAKSTTTAQETTSRPAKNTPVKKAAATTKKTATPVKVGRGRPKLAETAAEPAKPVTGKRKRATEDSAPEPPAKRRGRPPKTATALTGTADATITLKPRRKLPKKVDDAKPAAKTKTKASATKATAPAKKIGRPAGSKNKAPSTKAAKATTTKKTKANASSTVKDSTEIEVEDFDEGLTQPDQMDDVDEQYWLMKAEPDTRIENGVDVSFSVDKLAAATEPEPWDGVRNFAARNNMRAMRKGDLAFFYHSNCDVPGIVGVMRVAIEHEVDQSAFDPNHPYFDAKSDRSKPKWDCVKVEFVKKFDNIVSLKTVKETAELSGMQLASKSFGRLSVQKVSPKAWKHILKMAGEPEDLGVAEAKSGYEADTNGETDKEAVEDNVSLGDEEADVDAQKLAAYGDSEDDDLIEDHDQQLVIESTQLDTSVASPTTAPTEILAT